MGVDTLAPVKCLCVCVCVQSLHKYVDEGVCVCVCVFYQCVWINNTRADALGRT